MRIPRPLLAVVIALTLLAGLAPAQYSPGDVVVADQNVSGANWPLWGITRQGVVYTVTTSLPFFGWSMAPAPDNRTIWVSGVGRQGAANARIAPDGTITNFNADPKRVFCSIEVDGGGNAVCGDAGSSQILKYDGTFWTTLYSGAPFNKIHAAGIDLTSGDLVVFDSGPSAILRATLAGTPNVTTVFTPVLPAFEGAGLHADPDSRTMIGGWATGGRLGPIYSAFYRLTLAPPSALTTLQPTGVAGVPNSVDRDPFDGQFVIASAIAPAAILRFDARNNVVTTIAAVPSARPRAATVAGSRHLCALNEAKPGQTYRLLVSSPGQPSVPYAVALSFDYRPGIAVGGGRKVYLQPDALFALSLGNAGIFANMQGVLDASGEAVATIAIPTARVLRGVRFFAAAVTIPGSRISVISDTLGVTIR